MTPRRARDHRLRYPPYWIADVAFVLAMLLLAAVVVVAERALFAWLGWFS